MRSQKKLRRKVKERKRQMTNRKWKVQRSKSIESTKYENFGINDMNDVYFRKKIDSTATATTTATAALANVNNTPTGKGANAPKRKKQMANKKLAGSNVSGIETSVPADGHMTAEEVERHLQSRQSLMELVPERAPATVPNEMFSNEPSLDR